jgi:hypothetical protein
VALTDPPHQSRDARIGAPVAAQGACFRVVLGVYRPLSGESELRFGAGPRGSIDVWQLTGTHAWFATGTRWIAVGSGSRRDTLTWNLFIPAPFFGFSTVLGGCERRNSMSSVKGYGGSGDRMRQQRAGPIEVQARTEPAPVDGGARPRQNRHAERLLVPSK